MSEERQTVLDLVKSGTTLNKIPKEFLSDKEICVEALKINPDNFQYCSPELKQDREVVLLAVTKGGNIKYCPDFLNDKEIVLKVLEKADIYYILPKELKDDLDVARAALKLGTIHFSSLSEKILNNKEFTMESVRNKWTRFSECYFCDDKDVAMVAVSQYGTTINSCSKKLKNDPDLVLESFKTINHALSLCGDEIKEDKEFILKAIKMGQSLSSNVFGKETVFVKKFLNDRDVVLEHLITRREHFSMDHSIFTQDIDLYLVGRATVDKFNKNFNEEQLYKIALKLNDFEDYRRESLSIFQEIQQKHGNFYLESCFELAKLYASHPPKDLEESKNLFEICLQNNFQKKICVKQLELLEKFTNLSEEESQMLKSCSDGRNYELVKFLAKSSGPVIYLVKQKNTSKEFVLKRFPIGADLNFNETLKEVLCLMKLKNKYICEIIDFYVEENPEEDENVPYFFCLIMPFYPVDLNNFILKNKVDNKVRFFLTHY
jgi:hypothetical protein